jgi:hypothetical protein
MMLIVEDPPLVSVAVTTGDCALAVCSARKGQTTSAAMRSILVAAGFSIRAVL